MDNDDEETPDQSQLEFRQILSGNARTMVNEQEDQDKSGEQDDLLNGGSLMMQQYESFEHLQNEEFKQTKQLQLREMEREVTKIVGK